jgi:hypothetical protein
MAEVSHLEYRIVRNRAHALPYDRKGYRSIDK